LKVQSFLQLFEGALGESVFPAGSVKKVFKGIQKNPLNDKELIFKDALVDLRDYDGEWLLQSIRSNKQGAGGNAMAEITAEADKNKKLIRLIPDPFGEEAMEKDALVKFYKRYGFSMTDSGTMVRKPKEKLVLGNKMKVIDFE